VPPKNIKKQPKKEVERENSIPSDLSTRPLGVESRDFKELPPESSVFRNFATKLMKNLGNSKLLTVSKAAE
jgi:hypothetical protein